MENDPKLWKETPYGMTRVHGERIWWCAIWKCGAYRNDDGSEIVECPGIDLPENVRLHDQCGWRLLVGVSDGE